MKEKFFPKNPIPELLIRNRDAKYISDKYLDGVKFVDKSSKEFLEKMDPLDYNSSNEVREYIQL